MAAVVTGVMEAVNDTANGRRWNLCRRPWWDHVTVQHHRPTPAGSPRRQDSLNWSDASTSYKSVGGVARALLLQRRRLRFEPDKKLYFPYQPGKQATSAVRIKNVSRSHVAFKFQTTAPKSCFMRPPGGVLAPGECIVASVVKFIEHPERSQKKQIKDKFKIVSLKILEGADFAPEMFDEQKEHVTVEQILRVHFLDPEHPSSREACQNISSSTICLTERVGSFKELEKLKKRIAEADAAIEARKKPGPQEKGHMQLIGEGNALEEWNKMKLARQLARDDSG